MDRVQFTLTRAIDRLCKAAVLLSQGTSIEEAMRKLGVSEQTYYVRKKEYGGVKLGQARRLKEFETEEGRPKELVAHVLLDDASLKESLRARYSA